MKDEQKKILEEIKKMEEEMHEAEKKMTKQERFNLIYDMDDKNFELKDCRKE